MCCSRAPGLALHLPLCLCLCLCLGLCLAAAAAAAATAATAPAPGLRITAIAAAAGVSVLECWQLDAPVTLSVSPGTAGASTSPLGPVGNASFTVLPARFDGGLHNAPVAQYVAFLSGRARISLPGSADVADIEGGARGLIIAVDTAAVSRAGHCTTYPGDALTTAVQMPFRDGLPPPHKVLHRGPCRPDPGPAYCHAPADVLH